MLNCKQASKLASHAQDSKLSYFKRLNLKMHLMMCAPCGNYNKNLLFLRKTMRHLKDYEPLDKEETNNHQ